MSGRQFGNTRNLVAWLRKWTGDVREAVGNTRNLVAWLRKWTGDVREAVW